MKRVLKWDVPVDDKDHPIGPGRVLHVACQWSPSVVQVWTEETEETGENPVVATRRARVYGTGHPVPEKDEHLGSVAATGTALVWHVYGSPA